MKLSTLKPNTTFRIGKFFAVKTPPDKKLPLHIIGHFNGDTLFPPDFDEKWEYRPNYAITQFFTDYLPDTDDPDVTVIGFMKKVA